MAGDDVEIFVDANGAYNLKQAFRMGHRMADEYGVVWFEEPVSSDDLSGLAHLRNRFALDVTAGEYGYAENYFATMVAAGAVDCLQIDVTRCGGYTSWLRAAEIALAAGLQVSGHCAPSLHAPVATAVPNLRHVEYFHDHERCDRILFDGTLTPVNGRFRLDDRNRMGHGMSVREADAARYRVG